MSVRENLIIQADDITIVQGEKAKDYNVIITSNDGTPLSDVTLTIAFYNNDYSFVNDVTTNEYGVASVPLYLNGDSWSVDVHFKGDETYKPQLITKEINVEKFERLSTHIESKNLLLNEEDFYNRKCYTITLLDENDNSVPNVPVRVTVKETGVDNPQTLVDMYDKTSPNGELAIYYMDNNVDVEITTNFSGNVKYKGTINSDIVSYENTGEKPNVEFRVYTDGDSNDIQIKRGSDEWKSIFDYEILHSPLHIEVILNEVGNQHDCYHPFFARVDLLYDEINLRLALKNGDYKITVCAIWSRTYHSLCRTLDVSQPTDTRITSLPMISVNHSNYEVGNINHMSIKVDDIISLNFMAFDYRLYVGIGATGDNSTLEDLISDSEYVLTVPVNVGYMGVADKVECDVIVPSNGKYQILLDYPIIKNLMIIKADVTVTPSTKENATITQTGFGEQGQTYQDMEIISTNNNAEMHEKINDYYIMRLLNKNTNDELFFYSYLINNVTSSRIQFLLQTGNWELYLLGQGNDKYDGSYLMATAILDVDSEITPPTSTIIAYEENYLNLGTDSPTFADDTIATTTSDDDIHSIMALEFTNSNYYKLQFNDTISGNDSTIIFGADPNLETNDGLYINPNSITLWNDDIEMDTVIFDTPILNQGNNIILIQRYGTTVTVFANDVQVYQTDLLSWNTFGVYQDTTGSTMTLSTFSLEPYVVTDITPSVADYDGTIFGSNIHLEIDDNKLNMIDYGMLPQGAIGSGKIILNDVPLESANNYAIQLEMKYNNSRFERLNNLTGQMQMRVYEDILSSDTVKVYEKTLCSPMPVPNSKTMFTRHTDEGTLYFVQDPLDTNSSFLTNAYNQYKGGVEITTETGISLFNLDNAHSPVFVGNELVRAEFHRRSGFIRLARYDESTGDWVNVNTLKLRNYPQLSLNDYNDDYAEVQFGNTTWKFYRGRPFIVLNHNKDDLRIMNLVDRVYCETVENQRGMGFIVDQNPNEQTIVTDENGTVLGNYSTFNPQLSIQQFKQELHIGENIRLDNFELYEADSNQNIGDVATNSQLGILNIDNDNALQIYKDDTNLALNFPSYSNYVERVNDTFTLSIDYLDCPFETIKIKARGFDERGAVPVKDNIQYGIWEQTVTVEVDTTATDSVRATFTNCPSEVKYIDFVIFFTGANSTDIILKDLMYYDGDAILNHDVDTSRLFAEQVTINFADTYFANIYDENSSCGLCIARPYQEPFTLTTLSASSETVLIPYMKKATEWDKPQQVFLEYLNAKQQVIDIDWEN